MTDDPSDFDDRSDRSCIDSPDVTEPAGSSDGTAGSEPPDRDDPSERAGATDPGTNGPASPERHDLTEVARELYDLPFHRANDVEVVSATADGARTRWPFDDSLVGNPEVPAIHGGVVSAMADLTGAVPFVAQRGAYTPTIDLRVDYLAHAGEADLTAESTVDRRGETIGTASIVVESAGSVCARARGVYKLDR